MSHMIYLYSAYFQLQVWLDSNLLSFQLLSQFKQLNSCYLFTAIRFHVLKTLLQINISVVKLRD